MRVALVSGSWPPDRCGVGDYSARLAECIEREGIEIVRCGNAVAATVRGFGGLLRSIQAADVDLVHIQYPTMGYGRSLAPAALCLLLRVPVVVTLHEFCSFRFYRLPWFIPFALRAKGLVFTSAIELEGFKRRIRTMPSNHEIIPIGSNIPAGPDVARDPRSVCYFGLLMEGKGLEQFLAFTQLIAGQGFTISLIGAIPAGSEAFAASLLDQAKALGLHVHLNETAETIAQLLKTQRYAYLPFPDGATDKRGSLLAALVNGVEVMAPITARSRPPITDAVIHAGSPAEAAAILLDETGGPLRNRPPIPGDALSSFEWATIGRRHRALYERTLASA